MEPVEPDGPTNARRLGKGRHAASPHAGRAILGPARPRKWVRAVGWTIAGAFFALAAAVALVPVPGAYGGAPTVLYDRDGMAFATLSPGARIPLKLAAIPVALQDATIATEDVRFYSHHGIDPEAILRAFLADVRARAAVQGGSTITQQLAKNLFLTPTRTLGRKLEEVVYTLRLEATHSKPDILDMYLNTIYYGEGAYGVGAAAETYFGKPASQLDLAQSALLAGLPNAPAAYDPYVHPGAAAGRQRWVLHRMVLAHFITQAEADTAGAEPLQYSRGSSVAAPAAGYFVSYVLAEIGKHDPALEAAVRRGGYSIYTTMDSSMQAAADQAFAQDMPPGTLDAHGVVQPEGALVAIDPSSGAVRALVGGRSARTDPYNRAIYAMRQPGSTFKAFLYATAIAAGHTVTERKFDGPVSYPGANGQPYIVHDDVPYSYSWLTMRDALAVSNNVVAVKWAHELGPPRIIRTARAMGITSPLQPTLPLVLGTYDVTPLELADAYVPLANLGTAYAPWSIIRLADASGRTVWAPPPPRPRPALNPGVAYIVTNMLESVMTDGTGKSLLRGLDRPVAGKTGSTNNLKDAWFVGYTPDLVAAVWVGDDQPAPLGGYGATLAGPVWAGFIKAALATTPPHDWSMPANVVPVQVSAVDGLLPNGTAPTMTELFLKGTEPTAISSSTGAREGEARECLPRFPRMVRPHILCCL